MSEEKIYYSCKKSFTSKISSWSVPTALRLKYYASQKIKVKTNTKPIAWVDHGSVLSGFSSTLFSQYSGVEFLESYLMQYNDAATINFNDGYLLVNHLDEREDSD